MSRSLSTSALGLGLVVTIGGLLGPAAGPARAQGALGAAGTAGPRVVRSMRAPAAPVQYVRYYTYDPTSRRYDYDDVPVRRSYSYDDRTRQYFYDDVPVSRVTSAPTNTNPTSIRGRSAAPGMFNGPRRAAGIGAQGTDDRTNLDEWMSP
jgi:hypothetical protein